MISSVNFDLALSKCSRARNVRHCSILICCTFSAPTSIPPWTSVSVSVSWTIRTSSIITFASTISRSFSRSTNHFNYIKFKRSFSEKKIIRIWLNNKWSLDKSVSSLPIFTFTILFATSWWRWSTHCVPVCFLKSFFSRFLLFQYVFITNLPKQAGQNLNPKLNHLLGSTIYLFSTLVTKNFTRKTKENLKKESKKKLVHMHTQYHH